MLQAKEGRVGCIPGRGRFHVTADGRLYAFYYVYGKVSENRLVELRSDGTSGPVVRVPLKHPLQEYFTATVRAGSPPGAVLDVLGIGPGHPTG